MGVGWGTHGHCRGAGSAGGGGGGEGAEERIRLCHVPLLACEEAEDLGVPRVWGSRTRCTTSNPPYITREVGVVGWDGVGWRGIWALQSGVGTDWSICCLVPLLACREAEDLGARGCGGPVPDPQPVNLHHTGGGGMGVGGLRAL